MTKGTVLIMSSFFEEETNSIFETLKRIDVPKGTRKYLYTNQKFNSQKLASVVNMESGYPIEPLRLHNAAFATKAGTAARETYLRDGFTACCLYQAIFSGRHEEIYFLQCFRDNSSIKQDIFVAGQDMPVVFVRGEGAESDSFVIRLTPQSPECRLAVSQARELYLCGAAHAMDPICLETILLWSGKTDQPHLSGPV
ncbi:hypothetical protein [uncultured Roseibium sp.]|uniref:hypothetical protein n=1 Tax=uncultured Roseibium sp. TaxID=1936171 RepID=UPI00259A63DF|nr:hypothetical protein [uncultured Roseibium sp.]